MASRSPLPFPAVTPAMRRAGVTMSIPPARVSSPSSNPAKDAQLAAARARREQEPEAAASPSASQMSADDALYALAFGGDRTAEGAVVDAADEALYEAAFGGNHA